MNKPKEKVQNIFYIGNDTGFFQNTSQRFKANYSALNFVFPNLFFDSSKGFGPERIFLELIKSEPKIIYLDFCEKRGEMLYLAELLSRDPFFVEIPTVGFVDKKEDVRDCLGTGVDFIYVKGGEFHDLVYAPMNMAFPKKVVKPQFAKAKISREAELIDDFRVGFIAPTYIHVEGNFVLEEGKKVVFETEISPKNVPSRVFTIKNKSETNLYYDYNYSYDLDFQFVDPPEKSEDEQDDALGITDEKERVKAIKAAKEKLRTSHADYEESLKRSQKKHKEWVVDQMDRNDEKKTKVLIVDENMRVFSDNKEHTLDKQPYSFRCQTTFDNEFSNLQKLRPAIVAYQLMSEYPPEYDEFIEIALERNKAPETNHAPLEDADNEKLVELLREELPEKEKSEMSYVSMIIQIVKEMENYSPVIVIFRCYYQNSRALQEFFQYPMLVTNPSTLSLEVILNLAGIYEKKQEEKMAKLIKAKVAQLKMRDPQKYRRLNEADFEEKKYFIKKKNSLSYGALKLPVTLTLLTESELHFRTEVELPMKTYRLTYPLEMSIHLVPIEDGKDFLVDKGEFTYRGIIHSISEVDKKNLRQVVNEVFFQPLNEKRDKEQSEFKQLNEKVKEEIVEREKNIEDSREAAAKEAMGIQDDSASEANSSDNQTEQDQNVSENSDTDEEKKES